nr:hypothetical protein [Thermoanaerobaculia bacterium]
LIALLSTLDRQVARLAELAERRQGAQALAVLEELANETLDFVAKNLPERRDSWRPDFLLPALKGSHPALELFELRNQRLSLDLPRNLVREYAREPDRAARYLLHVGRGVLTLARAWFEELAQSFSTELRRSEWRSAFAAIEQDFENALATERATEKVI